MSSAIRLILILFLLMFVASGLSAQEAETATSATTTTTSSKTSTTDTATTAATAEPSAHAEGSSSDSGHARPNSYQVRETFIGILRNSPPELAQILTLEPTLLSNQPFLTAYPELSQFLTEHPEVRQHPKFYLAPVDMTPRQPRDSFGELFEALMIFMSFFLMAVALAWIIRTIIEQKRWSRLSRTQNEVHNKILDRFGTTEELLNYVKSPAGSKFLESAPIPLHTEPVRQSTPITRVILSVQVGVILSALAIGLMLVSVALAGESGRGLFAMGVIALSIGVGFALSALVSVSLSRKLGVFPPAPEDAEKSRLDDAGFVK